MTARMRRDARKLLKRYAVAAGMRYGTILVLYDNFRPNFERSRCFLALRRLGRAITRAERILRGESAFGGARLMLAPTKRHDPLDAQISAR